jgi:hypothetical protein
MAETRATSRAFRGPLEQIFVMAGFQPAAAEELYDVVIDAKTTARDTPSQGTVRRRRPDKIPDADMPTEEQVAKLLRLLEGLDAVWPEVDWKARAKEIAGVSGDMLTKTTMEQLLHKLAQMLEEPDTA